MRVIKLLNLLFLCILLQNCQGLMSGKNTTTDEFLVKKKDPLILPPKMDELPLPKSKKDLEKKNSVLSALGAKEESGKVTSDLEKMILKELNKKR